MEGLYMGHSSEGREKASKDVVELALIAKGGGSEIMIQQIEPGTLVTLSPDNYTELMEFFYMLNGVMIYDNGENSITLNEGDYFYTHGLKGTVYFKTVTEVKMIYVSSQPVFHLLSNEMQELTNIIKELEKKDPYTHGHDFRLQDYSIKIGEALNLSKPQLERLQYASLFHDIGKVKTPSEVLNKPGRLNSVEYDVIMRHPLDGKKILDGTFLRFVSKIVMEHHERLDGSGYPNGLNSDEISIEAKIIAVVDSYDAMTSDRPYRKALPAEYAIKDLKRLAGIHYDCNIINVFERILKNEKVL